MLVQKYFPRFLSIMLIVFGLGLLVLVLVPYSGLKTFSGSLMPDGEFETLTEGNMVVFRGIFLVGFLVSSALAYLFAFRRWGAVAAFLKQVLVDAKRFFVSLRPQKDDLWFWAAVLVFMAVAVLYRMEYIYAPLHHDDAYTYMAFGRSLQAALTDYHLPNNHVFHSILVYFSTQLFGNAPWAIRLPSFTAGVLLVPAVNELGKRFYDRWVGLFAALLVSIAPVMVGYSESARGYPLVMLFALLTLSLGDIVRKEKNLFAWGLISLFSALGFYAVPVMMYPFGILFLWLFFENQFTGPGPYRSKWQFIRYWLICGFLSAALTLVLYLPILVYSGPAKLFGNQFVSPAPWEDVFNIFVYQMSMSWQGLITRIPTISVWTLVGGVALGIVFHKRLSTQKIPLQAVALSWLAVLVLVQRPKDGGKLWSVLIVLFFLWAAVGIAGLLGKVKFKFLRGLPLLTAAGIGVILFFASQRAILIGSELSELWALRGDQENAVLFIQEQLMAGDEIVVASSDGAAVWYYAELHGVSDALYNADEEFNRLFVLVNPAEDTSVDAVVVARGPGLDMVSIESAQLLQTIGNLQLYVVPKK